MAKMWVKYIVNHKNGLMALNMFLNDKETHHISF